jgi:hypothetical protein
VDPVIPLRLNRLKVESAARDSFRMARSGTKTAPSGTTLFAFKILTACERIARDVEGWGKQIGHFALLASINKANKG